ncbi:unnamed protein product [Soboliphyme baturini]|uniref:Baculoviral IAP repeat-containing protein 5 n=1 Tax=Soboliphyme baturini TaxID=241478 RepID=A0A183IHI5_9BILA|nr:unnamed protein product [Soboliphyme baturini]
MAEAGFFHIPSKSDPDAVRCFVCAKDLDSWCPEDDPWSEHLKHSEMCPFAQFQKRQTQLTCRQWLSIMQLKQKALWKETIDQKISELAMQFEATPQQIFKRADESDDALS